MLVLLGVNALANDSLQRNEWYYLIAIGMAYGHTVGAPIFSLSRHCLSSIPRVDWLGVICMIPLGIAVFAPVEIRSARPRASS